LLLSDVYRREKKYAQTALLQGARLDPNHAPTFTLLGHYYRLVERDAERARRCYQKAISLDPLESEAGPQEIEILCAIIDPV
jgi:tetratricopeptide (TPR) repeat protein